MSGMRMWWLFVRRSAARWFVLVAVALLVLLFYRFDLRATFFEWRWTTVNVGKSLLWGAGLILGGTAWEAWRFRQRISAFNGNPRRSLLAVWAGACSWWLAFQVSVITAGLLYAWSQQAIGSPSVLFLVAQLVAVVGFCTVGAIAGWYVRSPVVAPALPIGYILLLATSHPGQNFSKLLTFSCAPSMIGLEFKPPLVWAKLIFFAALASFAAVLVLHRRLWRMLGAVVLLGVAGVAALPPILEREGDLVAMPYPAGSCVPAAATRVCSIADLRSWQRPVASELAPIVAALQARHVPTPGTFALVGHHDPENFTGGVLSAPDGETLRDPRVRRFLEVRALTYPDMCDAASTAPPPHSVVLLQGVLAHLVVNAFHIDADLTDVPGAEDAQRLAALPDDQRWRWHAAMVRHLWDCDASELDWPAGFRGSEPLKP